MVTPAGCEFCMDELPFTLLVVEGDFPWCAEAGSESVDLLGVAALLRCPCCAGGIEVIRRVFDSIAKCEVWREEKGLGVARNVRLRLEEKKVG